LNRNTAELLKLRGEVGLLRLQIADADNTKTQSGQAPLSSPREYYEPATKHPALDGWLYTTTRLLALHGHRAEQPRKAREQAANAMNELLRNPASSETVH